MVMAWPPDQTPQVNITVWGSRGVFVFGSVLHSRVVTDETCRASFPAVWRGRAFTSWKCDGQSHSSIQPFCCATLAHPAGSWLSLLCLLLHIFKNTPHPKPHVFNERIKLFLEV